MPRIERLHQNTPEWHRWRMQGIGASDAPAIMGETAFKTPRMLWSEKNSSPASTRIAVLLFVPSGDSSTVMLSNLHPGARARCTAAINTFRPMAQFSSVASQPK